MANLESIRRLQEHYQGNLPRYVRDHLGPFLLLEPRFPIKETFFKERHLWEAALEFYKNRFHPGIIAREVHVIQIRPLERIITCPNDDITTLLAGNVTLNKHQNAELYEELARCPDCNYIVYRKPTDKKVKEIKAAHEAYLRTIAST